MKFIEPTFPCTGMVGIEGNLHPKKTSNIHQGVRCWPLSRIAIQVIRKSSSLFLIWIPSFPRITAVMETAGFLCLLYSVKSQGKQRLVGRLGLWDSLHRKERVAVELPAVISRQPGLLMTFGSSFGQWETLWRMRLRHARIVWTCLKLTGKQTL